MYTRLFEAAIDTLRQFGRNDTHLAAELAATAMLHTHTRRIDYHPHVHLVVPGGVLHTKTEQWRKVKGAFLFNHFNLARVFRAISLKKLSQDGFGIPENPAKWVAHCKSVGTGEKAIQYLSRYLYRGVLLDSQLLQDDGTHVTFRYRESRTKKMRTRKLKGEKLMRLLMLHVLPKGFRRDVVNIFVTPS
ncbi:MAG: transposase [Chromatiaceae bacterium]|nr:transposase [Chromatiaceae bacterium]